MNNGVLWDVARVALVRTDVSEELSATFIRVTRIGELGTTLAVTSNRRTQASTQAWLPHSTNLKAPAAVAISLWYQLVHMKMAN
jgi:hypothetical protein